jgi:hypothetical protein
MESESNQTMKFGEFFRSTGRSLKAVGLGLALLAAPQLAGAQAIHGNGQGQNFPAAPAGLSKNLPRSA